MVNKYRLESVIFVLQENRLPIVDVKATCIKEPSEPKLLAIGNATVGGSWENLEHRLSSLP